MDDKNTRGLIKLYKKTNSEIALKVLIKNHQRAIFKAASELPHNVLTFDEKVQIGNELLLKLIKKFDLRYKIKFVTYLMNYCKFKMIDEIRRHDKMKADEIDYEVAYASGYIRDTDENIAENYELEEAKQRLIDALPKLPRTMQIIMACKLEGMTYVEIAKQSNVTPSLISQYAEKAQKQLKKILLDE